MATYPTSNMTSILKELYNGETEEERVWREFMNKQRTLMGLPIKYSKSQTFMHELVYNKNLMLELIPKNTLASCNPCPIQPISPTPLIIKP